MKFEIGSAVIHSVYGKGHIIDSGLGTKITKTTKKFANGRQETEFRRVTDPSAENYAVKFDKGGPVGFAKNSSNDVKQLTRVVA